jgi:5-methylcytosine-specific restriction protein A
MTKRRMDGPSPEVKLRTLRRDRFACVYCGVSGTEAELEVDHIVPVSKGGSHHIGNLAAACRSCNQKKSDGTLHRHAGGRNVPQQNGLVGMFLVTLKPSPGEYGTVQYQGRVLSVDDDLCLVQRYSFIDGRETDVIALAKADVLSQEKCRLFAQWVEWRRFLFEDGEAARRRRGDPVGWHGGDFEELIAFEKTAAAG